MLAPSRRLTVGLAGYGLGGGAFAVAARTRPAADAVWWGGAALLIAVGISGLACASWRRGGGPGVRIVALVIAALAVAQLWQWHAYARAEAFEPYAPSGRSCSRSGWCSCSGWRRWTPP